MSDENKVELDVLADLDPSDASFASQLAADAMVNEHKAVKAHKRLQQSVTRMSLYDLSRQLRAFSLAYVAASADAQRYAHSIGIVADELQIRTAESVSRQARKQPTEFVPSNERMPSSMTQQPGKMLRVIAKGKEPRPQAPEPQAPEPQAPEPQAPEPQAPEPQAPLRAPRSAIVRLPEDLGRIYQISLSRDSWPNRIRTALEPYGFVRDLNKRTLQEVISEQAIMLRYGSLLQSMTLQEISSTFNKERIRSRSGAPWTVVTLESAYGRFQFVRQWLASPGVVLDPV